MLLRKRARKRRRRPSSRLDADSGMDSPLHATGRRRDAFGPGIHAAPRRNPRRVFPRPLLVARRAVLAGRRRRRHGLGMALRRSGGSLAAPWLSHALIDTAILLVGYDMVRAMW